MNVVEPLFVELEIYNESLDEQEFVESCLALLKTKTVLERGLIMSFAKRNRSTIGDQPSFNPVISEKTKVLAVERYRKAAALDLSQFKQVDRLYMLDHISK